MGRDRFDLTYEGLKHKYRAWDDEWYGCFDLTYEGLKRWGRVDEHGNLHHCFDLTYEGLKPLTAKMTLQASAGF